MLLQEVVATSRAVSATRSRKEKVRLLAAVLAEAPAGERPLVARYLGGSLRQRRTGVGWRSLGDLPSPADEATLTVAEVDATLEKVAGLSGPGSAGMRRTRTEELFGRATEDEQAWLRGIITGEVRQGALEAMLTEAVAAAADLPVKQVRRAAMLAGGTAYVVEAAFEGEEALAGIGLTVGRPIQPMLASSAPDLAAALEKVGADAAVDAKLDGIRIQVHRDGQDVRIATRSLDDITERLPEVVEIVRSLPADRLVLDGEAMWLADDGGPRPFQETASRTASGSGGAVTPYFFDLLHRDGRDLLDLPAHERWAELDDLVPEPWRVTRWRGEDPADAQAFADDVLASGQEGVVVKAAGATYDAGRRGAAWVKVKPVHTLDLVVLAVEWGSGRRRGWLSNIHLGARDPDGGFVMLGKTFKGMTDEILAWQTERFTELATVDDPAADWVVPVRPEQVVEIAFDGLQRSTRYPGGLALRFARVLRYRDDKSAAEADTIEAVRDHADGPTRGH
ncbi:ATP-dependent DNA ligase [Nocardioides panacisoli]|uniref:ATP-dependent DNA ligase n=1 Tax=Nocardioides panacisoli TaxID=627624 RepID=UPI001C6302E6|nr:ATP-dependent DNA ligase [Nocardioides panacisoli]QYJ04859.1 ATP-dependent DNA ligase [Nocardioides panacisoli]